jgi:hypothetical protein
LFLLARERGAASLPGFAGGGDERAIANGKVHIRIRWVKSVPDAKLLVPVVRAHRRAIELLIAGG